MNSCWKTVNISRELGITRITILSCLSGIMSFIFLYLPYSLMHQNNNITDYGFLNVLGILLILPTLHHFAHAIPLILFNKKMKGKIQFEFGFWPTFTFTPVSSLSKWLAIVTFLAPTLFLSLPGIIASAVFPSQYPYFILFTAINIGISYKDFIYLGYFLRAPKKCIIENGKNGFDILVQK